MMNEVKGAEHTLFQSKIYCVLLLFLLGSVPCFWPESGLPLLWAFISGGLPFGIQNQFGKLIQMNQWMRMEECQRQQNLFSVHYTIWDGCFYR